MRVSIRAQFVVVVLLVALIPLAILSIAVWIVSYAFITGVTNAELTLTASLKASQIASDLLLIQATCATIVTRILLQNQLKEFYLTGSVNSSSTVDTVDDVMSALESGGYSSLLQTIVYSRNQTGNPEGLLRVTGNTSTIILAATYPNGTHAKLGDNFPGDGGLGYPESLYPNITYVTTNISDPMDPSNNLTTASAFADLPLNQTSSLLLGPLLVNSTYALVSLTIPILDNANMNYILGYMTVVAAATSLMDVVSSRDGLAKTGSVQLIAPSRRENLYRYNMRPASPLYPGNATAQGEAIVHYVFPPDISSYSGPDRHSAYNDNLTKFGSSNFTLKQYPAALKALSTQNSAINNASSTLNTKNENNVSVAVGYARPQSSLVAWLLIVERSHAEAWEPVYRLRKIVLACVFGTFGFVILLAFPMAHYSVRPIRRLRDATEKSITPAGYTPNGSFRSDRLDDVGYMSGEDVGELHRQDSRRSKKGILVRLKGLSPSSRRKTNSERHEEHRRRVFRIPAKVQDRKHCITDELTELTATFNDMSDELMLQYTSLEEKVAIRTQELEVSKKAAEAANESKTLFIANISHELKTPLNGIMGMTAVCMSENDLSHIQRNLQVIYKSGDLLLHLLNDLLTFSKNQIGQQLALEEREFRLVDIKTQITTIFMKQIHEGKIDFGVKFISTDVVSDTSVVSEKVLPAVGPLGTGRLKDMSLWGDQHRILQVIINLVSNSLKFTPEGGKVEVRIKCLGEAEMFAAGEGRNSFGSKQSSQRNSRPRVRPDSTNSSQISKTQNATPTGTALSINPMDPKATHRVHVRERSPTPPPKDAKTFIFQFEVEDTGPGIPLSLRDKVFEPFVQGDLGLSRKFGGTGLGLSICSQLATLMGGTIELDSTEGVGTTFTMKIPLKHTKSRAPSTSSTDPRGPGSRPTSFVDPNLTVSPDKNGIDKAPKSGFDEDTQPRLVGLSQPFFAKPAANGNIIESTKSPIAMLDGHGANPESRSKIRVLVAEDNLVNQEVVLRMLKLEHIYDVVVANDGQEAFDHVKANIGRPFDLIFMDIQMPHIDGLQSTRLIREMGYSAPIVALTAFAEESNVQDCIASGMDMFLSKPIRRPALKQVLRRFTTIPEENETASVGVNSSKKKKSPDASTSTDSEDSKAAKSFVLSLSPAPPALANGSAAPSVAPSALTT